MYLDFEKLDLDTLKKEYSDEAYLFSVLDFLEHFMKEETFVSITSGSTGTPKSISFSKYRALESAKLSNEFFNITHHTFIIHCLDIKYIGSKMLLIRALIAKAKVKVFKPSLDFFNFCDKGKIDFISLTPLHLHAILNTKPDFFSQVKLCLIGASGVSKKLENAVSKIKTKTKFYESFAMTETLSHFAIRNISAREKSFRLLNGFKLSVNSDQCLQLQHDLILPEGIESKDVVNIEQDGTFTFLGRADNVINTGGVKVNPEVIEYEWSSFLPFKFIIASEDDPVLGQKIIMIVENNPNQSKSKIIDLLQYNNIPNRLQPKAYFTTNNWVESETHKPIRRKIYMTRIYLN